ncbi:MAG: hypothetical protein HFJ05_02965 [Eubacterium sp.]|nr:hypothetical protein [Eubacterium sp.]
MKNKLKAAIRILFTVLILISLTGSAKNVHADMIYTNSYQKVKVKKTGWYELKNNAKSAKANTDVNIVKTKKGKAVYSGKIGKKKKDMVYLKKGTYFIRQEIGEYQKKKVNKNFQLKYKGKKYVPNLNANTALNIQGDVVKSSVYVKFKAAETGEIEIKLRKLLSNSQLAYQKQKNYANITLCNQKKKAITEDTQTRIEGFYSGAKVESQNFAVIKGGTYYFKISGLTTAAELKYTYKKVTRGIKSVGSYGKTKETAVSLNGWNGGAYLGYIGLNGAETHWYTYVTNKDVDPLFFGENCLGWNVKNRRDGFKIEVYNQYGSLIPTNSSVSSSNELDQFIPGTEATSGTQNLYIKISVQEKCPTSYSISISNR